MLDSFSDMDESGEPLEIAHRDQQHQLPRTSKRMTLLMYEVSTDLSLVMPYVKDVKQSARACGLFLPCPDVCMLFMQMK